MRGRGAEPRARADRGKVSNTPEACTADHNHLDAAALGDDPLEALLIGEVAPLGGDLIAEHLLLEAAGIIHVRQVLA